MNEDILNFDLIEDVLELLCFSTDQAARGGILSPAEEEVEEVSMRGATILVFLPGVGEISVLLQRLNHSRKFGPGASYGAGSQAPTHFILRPLHSSLSGEDQRAVFRPTPPDAVKVVLSTNIAETSVTIPGVRAVIDCGRVKEIRHAWTHGQREGQRGGSISSSSLVEDWCSVASCRQRAGRAGRTAPGLVCRLFSSGTHEAMKHHALPELQRVPLESLCLEIKTSGLDEVGCCGAFFSRTPEPPPAEAVDSALATLLDVGAVALSSAHEGEGGEGAEAQGTSGEGPYAALQGLPPLEMSTGFLDDAALELTALGRHLAALPLDVRAGKMLVFGTLLGCLDPVATAAAVLSSRSPFSSTHGTNGAEVEAARRLVQVAESDFLTAVAVFDGFTAAGDSGGHPAERRYCSKLHLSMAALNEIRDLRRQFAGLLQSAGLFAHRDRTSSLVGGAYHNRHRTNRHLVSAVVSAGCYPHLAVLKSGNADGRRSAGKLEWHCARRGTKSQALTRVHVAPESVNHNARTATYPFLVFFEKRIHGASVSASASAGGHARPAAGQGGNSGRTMLMRER